MPLLSGAQSVAFIEDWSTRQADSLRVALHNSSNDSVRMGLCRSLGFHYQETNRDSSLHYHREQLRLAKKLNQPIWQADALDGIGYAFLNLRDFPNAIQSLLDGQNLLEAIHAEENAWNMYRFAHDGNPRTAKLTVLGFIHLDLGSLYSAIRNVSEASMHFRIVLDLSRKTNNTGLESNAHTNLAGSYLEANNLDSAFLHAKLGYALVHNSGFNDLLGYAPRILGEVYLQKGDYIRARKYIFESISQYSEINHHGDGLAQAYVVSAMLYKELDKLDSSLLYVLKGIAMLQSIESPNSLSEAFQVIAEVYEAQNRYDSAYKYQSLSVKEYKKAVDLSKISQFQNINIHEHLRVQELEAEKVAIQNRIRIYGLVVGVAVLLIVGILLYRNNLQKQRANSQLAQQRDEIQSTLTQLKSTQSQLIQSEKMASLGELTAGIAHEIQNPLNFVNNFSEVNSELVAELKDALAKGNLEEAKAIAATLEENETKIVSHGKRADAIVKGMLQHSRKSSGQKEPTDINALCDEYLRLAYHGLRAKDKSFNAKFETQLDPTLPKMNVIPQDIGRVVLNLITNAFYAVNEKRATNNETYEPTVTVRTKRSDNNVLISVKDNGPGIPDHIKGKIFQPFFTTKPTGQGTGLGLSLSYDIVKAHGGTLKVVSTEGTGSEFSIQLPS
jgi:signal transduction histidine kinase